MFLACYLFFLNGFAQLITHTCWVADNRAGIPSESSILNAKKKRERMRASNGEDYISLSVIKRSDESKDPHPESRLMREEDELGEGDDGMCFFFLSFFFGYNFRISPQNSQNTQA